MTMISSEQLDALKEMVSVGMGQAADILNEMLESHIELKIPALSIVKSSEFKDSDIYKDLNGDKLTSVSLGFKGSFNGNSTLVFPEKSAANLVAALTDEESGSSGMDSITAGTLSEIGNIVINGVMGSISNYLTNSVDYSLPNYMEGELLDLLKLRDSSEDSLVLLAETSFNVQNLQVDGSIFIVFEFGSFGSILEEIDKLYSN